MKERFVPRKGKVYLLSREEKEEVREFILRAAEEGVHPTVQVTLDSASIYCREKEWKEADSTRLLIFK